MEEHKHHIVSYRKILIILALLVTLTLVSVGVTSIHLGALTVLTALLIALIKSSFVLGIFMHLRFDDMMYTLMVVGVLLLIAVVIVITLFDYIFR